MVSRGFIDMAFNPAFTGKSGGEVQNVAYPNINTEDFSAAVDLLSTQDFIDFERIGIIGICVFAGMVLNASAMDIIIKATVTSTMYYMSLVNAYGYFDKMSTDERYKLKKSLNNEPIEDYRNGSFARAGGVIDPLQSDVPFYIKYYYKTERGYTNRSLN